jgi:hypothetical protein
MQTKDPTAFDIDQSPALRVSFAGEEPDWQSGKQAGDTGNQRP